MQTGDLVLDFYDDKGSASTFRELFPTRDSVPVSVKTAHVLTDSELGRLPDDAFALVVPDESGGSIRKFACVDAGNTALSVAYFLHNQDRLSEKQAKTAASKLIEACGWYDLVPPQELSKAAGLFSMGLTSAVMLPEAKRLAGEAKHGVSTTLGSGGVIRPQHKHAEVVGSHVMPLQEPTNHTRKPKAVIRKTASSALEGRYPLDTYEHVKMASEYFDTYGQSLSPADRREYCTNMVSRADELHVSVSDVARKYASASYAPAEEFEVAMDCRRALLSREQLPTFNKLASVAGDSVDPEIFALALAEFDKTAGLDAYYDRDVYDPYFSVFGVEKQAQFMEVMGSDYVNGPMLERVAASHSAFFTKHFGEDFAEEFRKDPIAIFKSLPMEQKKVISRLAADVQPTLAQS